METSRLLVAVSGGRDSIVLTHLLYELKYDFALAHCNFSLRGAESDADEQFVIELGDKLSVEVFSQQFDTKAFANEHGISIQMAARELRYRWFEELKTGLGFDYVLTAHHANDNVETFLINLGRGSGLEGLVGIPAKNDYILRPLLSFSQQQLASYAEKNDLIWREDSSNASDKYLRNHIRHHVVPALEESNEQFLENFGESQKYLKEAFDLLEDYTAYLHSRIITESFQGYQLSVPALKSVPHTKAVMFQLLKHFNFTAWDDVYNLLDAQSGKWVSSGTHRLIKDRDVLILTVAKEREDRTYSIIDGQSQLAIENIRFYLKEVQDAPDLKPNEALFDKELLKFPLTLRKWRTGDYFYPFGMSGKKKVSKYFKDEKFSAVEKESTWLLCSGDQIIWVVGHRTDDRYKVTPSTQNLLKIKATYV